MTEYDFLFIDRLQKIRSIDELHNIKEKSYIAFSGGKDSTALSFLIDLALPDNKIPRVFVNTGIEYKAIVEFVKKLQKKG